MQLQAKLMNQTSKNGKKPTFGLNFDMDLASTRH